MLTVGEVKGIKTKFHDKSLCLLKKIYKDRDEGFHQKGSQKCLRSGDF